MKRLLVKLRQVVYDGEGVYSIAMVFGVQAINIYPRSSDILLLSSKRILWPNYHT